MIVILTEAVTHILKINKPNTISVLFDLMFQRRF